MSDRSDTDELCHVAVKVTGVWYDSYGCSPGCPRCGSTYLHQEEVTVFSCGEDASVVQRTQVDGGSIESASVHNTAANPSSRRHGLTIGFWCENCSKDAWTGTTDLELCIAQHKGETVLYWRFPEATLKDVVPVAP